MKNPLATWETAGHTRVYAPTIHLLLDASASMTPYAGDVTACLQRYLDELRRIALPTLKIDQRTFNTELSPAAVQSLATARPIPYAPSGGTYLHRALKSTLESYDGGEHLLIVLSDGQDGDEIYHDLVPPGQRAMGVLASTIAHRLTNSPHILPVFLGAYPDALRAGLALGIAEGNCLVFTGEQFPQAFATLTRQTTALLTSAPAQRKLLRAGFFGKES